MVHQFKNSIENISLPEKFTYPFNYTPHPLCVIAADEVKQYLNALPVYPQDISQGKMFGVLIVKDNNDTIGYIAAYSGNINSSKVSSFFVPPVYDLLSPSSFFKGEEEKITKLNTEIASLENKAMYAERKRKLSDLRKENTLILENRKAMLKQLKSERDERRKDKSISHDEEDRLIKESQHQKAEFKRLSKSLSDKEKELQDKISATENEIHRLKEKRKADSEKLQKRIFSEFKFLNALGQEEDLWTIFSSTPSKTPPAGAGECAAPKLLQYAFLNKLRPIAMGEFWIGKSPSKEIRQEGLFYPSCMGKCKPILSHMLVGLTVDEDPAKNNNANLNFDIVFEDECLIVVNKPSGMLSVPGKGDKESVESMIKKIHPEITGPITVHRLDMATSGLMIIAKNKEVHKILQDEFISREVKKKYIAILDGAIKNKEGFIRLPLSADYYDRPRQRVDYESGKPAVTRYKVVEIFSKGSNTYTKIELFPLTGRTHQLRVHCAHKDGLGTPILGDELYGRKESRLYLHAKRIEFRHPVTNKIISFEEKENF